MAGTPADLTVYKDSTSGYQLRDHTYYGKGCKNGWGTDGDGGSQTPCSDSDAGGRYVKTADNETQKNGTYYHFQAATSGTGGTLSTNNANSPDTFCPLGWQLPYSGTGGDYYNKTKSYYYLIITKYGYDTAQDGKLKARSYPLSGNLAGQFYWFTGRLYFMNDGGGFLSSTISDGEYVWRLRLSKGDNPRMDSYDKIRGYSVRCVTENSTLEKLSMASA